MTRLTHYALEQPRRLVEDTEDAKRIEQVLAGIGIRYERWPAEVALADDAGQEEVLRAYAKETDRLMTECGYRTADVIRLAKGAANAAELRARFLDEHIHDEDEVRFFVEGRGAFYLRGEIGVHRVICERGDLLGVPAGTRHWFDMGAAPHFCAIRLFTDPAGWVARFTSDKVAGTIPRIDG
ncbi:MAG TPA: cupin domain-containing protein [Stellaceae bacterium]|jgi:1,2-dihydroxy-3-keto-5-methylthiopentene dioxygenase|nr:cupin domain-containing protein [Stellaceae bacterium]